MYDEYFSHAIPSVVDGNDIPLGMGMAFAEDLSALTRFAALPPAEQQRMIERAHTITSKQEMQELISSIGSIG